MLKKGLQQQGSFFCTKLFHCSHYAYIAQNKSFVFVNNIPFAQKVLQNKKTYCIMQMESTFAQKV